MATSNHLPAVTELPGLSEHSIATKYMKVKIPKPTATKSIAPANVDPLTGASSTSCGTAGKTRTPAIKRSAHHIIAAHNHSSDHREEVLASAQCGCFYCLRIFSPNKITDWYNDASGVLKTG